MTNKHISFRYMLRVLDKIPEEPTRPTEIYKNVNRHEAKAVWRLVSIGLVEKVDGPRKGRDSFGSGNFVDGRTKYLFKISERGLELREMYRTLVRELKDVCIWF